MSGETGDWALDLHAGERTLPEQDVCGAIDGGVIDDEHLTAEDLERLAQVEWTSDRTTALRLLPAWRAHLIACNRCATELSALRRALGLGEPAPPRPVSRSLVATLANLREAARRRAATSPRDSE